MHLLRRLKWRLEVLFRKERAERELAEELEYHLERETQANIQAGMRPDDALRKARSDFGGIEQTKEQVRDARGGRGMDDLVQDTRFALRTFRRRPAFTAVAAATLGLGIGTFTAMFSVLHGVILCGSPFQEPERLINVFQAWSSLREVDGREDYWDRVPIDLRQYRDWRDGTTQFEDVAIHRVWEMSLTNLGDPKIEMVGVGSASLLRVLKIQPTLGRWFLPEEEGFTPGTGAQVAVLGHEMWASVFAADPNVLGRTLTLDERSFTIVGVLPARFRLRWLGHPTTALLDTGRKRVWVPVGATGGNMGGGPRWEAIGRLAAGAGPEAAFAETRAILQAETDPNERSVKIVPRSDAETRGFASPLVLLFSATGLLLLIACANVAMIILGEMPGRRREITTRAALGAGSFRIVRQLLTESIVLGLLGSALGGGIAWATVRALVNMAPSIPRIDDVGMDLTVFFFAAVLGTLAGLLFGLIPALVSARESAEGALRPHRTMVTVRGQRLQRAVLVSQVTLTVILLVAGGLLVRSYTRLLTVDPGFDAAHLVSVHMSLPESRYPGGHEHPEGRQARWEFYQQVLRNARSVPGVVSAGMTSGLPFPGKRVNLTNLRRAGSDPESGRFVSTGFRVGPGYLETLGIPLLAGRTFTETDNSESDPVVVISEAMARRYWPDESPIGSQLRHWVGTLTVVGVVGDVRRANLAAELEPTFYLSLAQVAEWVADPVLLVRTREDPRRVISALREAIWSVEPNVPVDQAGTMTSLVAGSANDVRFRTLLMGVFGVVAALLAATGVYGVTARAVAQGARELGIRVALGARPGVLIGSAVQATGMLAGFGILLGLVLSLGVGRLLSGFLFGVEATDPLTYGAASSLVLLACLLAGYLPARHITRLHPADVLKAE